MTERLYYEDSYMREFDAVVTGCEEKKGRFLITLDRSAFYPEGGGQSGDRGYLTADGARRIEVLDTHERGEDIYVSCPERLSVGEQVHGVLDWGFRFDRMQNHSGEHILSGLIHERYGYNNVGFHMSTDRMTIDLDGEIPEEDLEAAALAEPAEEPAKKKIDHDEIIRMAQEGYPPREIAEKIGCSDQTVRNHIARG